MIILMTLLIFIKITITASGSAGSTIFYNKKHAKNECWNEDEITKLRARKAFEELVPVKIEPNEVDVNYIKDELRYFRRALRFVDRNIEGRPAYLLKEALADTIGAHLRKDILPTVRFAFYAGYIPYRNARQLHELYEEQKKFLNSQGLGWKTPDKIPKWSNLTVSKILIDSGTIFDPCSSLVTKRDSNSCIHIPKPKFDDEYEPTAIALPFKSGGLVSLTSPNSNNILLKYYTTASRCILGSSPEKCRHSDFLTYNNELWHWMKRDVAPHLLDEKLYPAYAGVLRIAAAVQTYGKGLSRRNLFEDQDGLTMTKWHPWQSLTNSYIYVNADWTPKVYILVVILIAISIYLVQICYNYMCDDSCRCRTSSVWGGNDGTVAYAKVETNFPAILPHSAVYYSDKKRAKSTPPSKPRSASMGSIKTQKVFDLNENTEKMMAVLVSENEQFSEQDTTSSEGMSDIDPIESNLEDDSKDRSQSPPKLETSISQVKLVKTPRQPPSRSRTPMYSTATTSTMTRGDSYQPTLLHASDTVWTGTESSTSSCSITSTTSKSHRSTPRTSRSSRNLAWARRVISKGSLLRKVTTSSRTDVGYTSFTTPPSRR